jgi:hypothetical protein
MANTYNWQINALDTNPTQGDLTDVVYNIHWTLTATSEQVDSEGNAYTAESIGTQSISNPEGESFTAFEDLTQEIVEGWLESSELDVEAIKSSLDYQITEAITPTSVTKNVPW